MEDDYAEYRCSACKKAIKNQAVECKSCVKLFYHPSCVGKHRVYDKNKELVTCQGPFEKFKVDGDLEENMRKTINRDRMGPTGSMGSVAATSSGNKIQVGSIPTGMDAKIEWILKIVKEIKDETVYKREMKIIIKEIIREEMGDIRKELEDLRRTLVREKACEQMGEVQRNYSEAVKEKKKEKVIIIKPKMQQESEVTKKLIKEKINIKNMDMGIMKFKKGSKGTVIMGCETGEEIKKLKNTVQAKLGENFKVIESPQVQPKIKIISIEEEEMKLDDDNLIAAIKKQNKIEVINEKFHMRIVKRMDKEKRNENQYRRTAGAVIIELDEVTHDLILKKGKLNMGWKRCPVFNHINVKRCYKCWGYYHMAKNCTREEICHKCAGNHKADECKTERKKCVNCMYKNKMYNLKINDEHDALNKECPTYLRALQEEKRRAGWDGEK